MVRWLLDSGWIGLPRTSTQPSVPFNIAFERRLEHLRNLGFIAALGLVVALLGVLLPILYAEYGKSREVEAQQGAEIRNLRELLQEQGKRLEAITARQQTSAPPSTAVPATRQARP